MAKHPVCGLGCQSTRIASCWRCFEQDGAAVCEPPPNAVIDICLDHRCTDCPPGTTVCQGSSVASCFQAASGVAACPQICKRIEMTVCEKGCQIAAGGAVCD